jgi:hypothetical protein
VLERCQRAVNGAVTYRAGKADVGRVIDIRDLPGVGPLIGAKNGLFVTRTVNGASPSIGPAKPTWVA